MKIIFLDTETTGFSPRKGDRITEIACVEMVDGILTGKIFHKYVNPERKLSKKAAEITGLSLDLLKDKPLFKDVANEFLEFVKDAKIVIHNAPFDVRFINNELEIIKSPVSTLSAISKEIIDTLTTAKSLFPKEANSIDALCLRFNITNDRSSQHGALIDAKILASIYTKLINFDPITKCPVKILKVINKVPKINLTIPSSSSASMQYLYEAEKNPKKSGNEIQPIELSKTIDEVSDKLKKLKASSL